MKKLADKLESLLSTEQHNVLKFSISDVPGRYKWGSVLTDSQAIVSFLCLCWNERLTIIKALRKFDGD